MDRDYLVFGFILASGVIFALFNLLDNQSKYKAQQLEATAAIEQGYVQVVQDGHVIWVKAPEEKPK